MSGDQRSFQHRVNEAIYLDMYQEKESISIFNLEKKEHYTRSFTFSFPVYTHPYLRNPEYKLNIYCLLPRFLITSPNFLSCKQRRIILWDFPKKTIQNDFPCYIVSCLIHFIVFFFSFCFLFHLFTLFYKDFFLFLLESSSKVMFVVYQSLNRNHKTIGCAVKQKEIELESKFSLSVGLVFLHFCGGIITNKNLPIKPLSSRSDKLKPNLI